jgi:hypothetical protein
VALGDQTQWSLFLKKTERRNDKPAATLADHTKHPCVLQQRSHPSALIFFSTRYGFLGFLDILFALFQACIWSCACALVSVPAFTCAASDFRSARAAF